MLPKRLFPESSAYCYVRTLKDAKHDQLNLENYDGLHPLERTLVAHSVDARKAEFGDARWCAHQALAELGYSEETPILRGTRGMPLWPDGFAGSMTHTNGLRAAVVVPTSHIRSIGLDAEPDQELPEEIIDIVARPGEQRQFEQLRQHGIAHPDRLLFCSKEALYKAWFPITERWLDFHQAEIDIRADGTLVAYLLVRPTPVPLVVGRWASVEGYLIVTATIERVSSYRYLNV
ncbi:4'-phosphopantetheinyl transferase family protein [Corynebacterium renale]|uniref:4'-phosphopantetheinyl transferase EntD n=1 Tax=Corynebacterium renale TaxID=1724 RepID=A0A2A9DQ90_9CORY|nr:4'-phosphopantetheinyl transferase superfamily protein [Corynebacterium renale]PFG28526.1 4'-phosphopantetheinyl transferase EntD [Corynebacterium renale]SQI26256.1 4'-phosphopantetheinyl transferase [Corynebacterium renale]